MRKPPLTPTAVLPPLPWFLGEPPTYPEALTLAIAARNVLWNRDRRECQCGQLVVRYWGPTPKPCVREGLGIWWQDKLVLLATGDGEVWAYHAGSPWEEALGALAKEQQDG